ncbi:carbonic anhydrase [Parathalassolituus penaei]|uniref:Carbonic anhydrase n=1 Tax=Parathalassolituus penaei TaxID=2997323 RepID=A0A9X3EAQ7_9GAMM|nr:carbonic anhydrase family protein [Parathalassolituus penaei]MCY0964068.1 carbonic anhydrase family protein [Parathalassolituus penaei]
MYKKILLAGAVMAFAGVPVVLGAGAHWEYEGAEGPEHWGDLDAAYTACKVGKNQSPVDISGGVDAELPPITFNYVTRGDTVLNNGHTVQVNYLPGSSIEVNGHKYELKQFHFHAPSENTINGESFPMEGHFVHADADGNLAVVGVMFREGEMNDTLQIAWDQLPMEASEPEALTGTLNAARMLPDNRDYYQFSGSLTTPPCSEGVNWMVLKGVVTASPEQLKQFTAAVHHANNRPVQPLNARVLIR